MVPSVEYPIHLSQHLAFQFMNYSLSILPTHPSQAEASILCSIHHPNIVRFYGMAIDNTPRRGPSYYLVSDLKDCDLRCACVSKFWLIVLCAVRLYVFVCIPLHHQCVCMCCSKMIDNESQPAKAVVYRIATEICLALVSVWTRDLALPL